MRHHPTLFHAAVYPAPVALRRPRRAAVERIACTIILAWGLAAYGVALWLFAKVLWTLLVPAG